MIRIIGLGAAAFWLAGCGGGGSGSSNAAGTAATARPPVNDAAPANGAAPAREAPPNLAIDQQLVVDTCIPRADRGRPIPQLGAARRAALNLCINNETVRQLAQRLPIRINANTQIDRIGVEGPALVYRYRLAGRIAEMRPGTPDRLDAMTRHSACAGDDVQQTIALGGVQVYRWVDRDGAPISEVRIDRC